MFFMSSLILKLIRFTLIVFEILFINNILAICRILDSMTVDIRMKILEKIIPTPLRKIKHDDNSFYVGIHGAFLVSPEYWVNRIWIGFCDTISNLVPGLPRSMSQGTFMTGTFGMIGLNGIEVFDLNNDDRIMAEKVNNNFILYNVDNDNLRINGTTDNINSRIVSRRIDDMTLTQYTDTMLSNNIKRLSFINAKIYSIGTQTLEFSNPVMKLLRSLCRETMYDRVIFSGYKPENAETMDLSTIHKFTKNFYMEEELMINFHFYKYCQQVQRILDTFIMRFCEKYCGKIDNTPEIENFVNAVSQTFSYDSEDDGFAVRTMNCDINAPSLTIDDVLIAVTFNVIEYSMNRIFIEYYWDKQGYFPYSRNGKICNVISRVSYSKFMGPELDGLVGEENRKFLLESLRKLYIRFRADSAPFVECINPDRMKHVVLGI